MSTELALQDRPALVAAPKYSDDQMQLLTDTIARGCDQNEFKLFIEIAKMSRLNPFTGQIRPVKRWNSDLGREAMVVQTGIDGYRAIASRTGDLAGISDASFDTEDAEHPNWAKVTVYRWSHGEKVPFSSTARWKEYVQTKKGGAVNAMWTRMPYLMLAKCAEALALRKAFPDDLAGIYTEEEMGQADNPIEGGGGKPPVAMPKRSSEKTAEPAKNGSAGAAPEKVEGSIEKIREGQNGAQWLMLKDGRILHLAERFADEDIKEGVSITVGAVKVQRDKDNTYFGVVEVFEIGIGGGGSAPQAASAEEQAAFAEQLDPDAAKDEVNLADLVESGQVKKASEIEAPKKGVIGSKDAGRIYAAANQNKNNNHGLKESDIKKIIAQAPLKLESLSDLPKDQFDNFMKIARGDIDWRPMLQEE